MTARVILHPALQRRYPPGDILRSWQSRGYVLSNTTHGRVEVHPPIEAQRSVVRSISNLVRHK